MKKINTANFVLIGTLILAASLSRLITNGLHIWNVAPMAGIALFAGANFIDKKMAFIIPVVAMLITDAILGFHSSMWMVYGCFILFVFIGFALRNKQSAVRIVTASLLSSVLFFLLTNLAVWSTENLYPHSAAGLSACYTAAIPFFWNTLLGDLFYSTVLFGGYYLLKMPITELATRRNQK